MVLAPPKTVPAYAHNSDRRGLRSKSKKEKGLYPSTVHAFGLYLCTVATSPYVVTGNQFVAHTHPNEPAFERCVHPWQC